MPDARQAAHRRPTGADLLLVAFSVVTAASGQALLRVGASGLRGGGAEMAKAALGSPAILAGLTLYVASAVVWMVVLSRVPLSIAYPLGSSNYVLVAIAGWAMGESLPPARIVGLGVVIAGIALVGMGARR